MMKTYILIFESFFYGLIQNLLDDNQYILNNLDKKNIILKYLLLIYGLLFTLYICRLSFILDNYIELLVYLIFISDINDIYKKIALGTSFIFGLNPLIYNLTFSYILAYCLNLHENNYIILLIEYINDIVDKNYYYINIPNYLLYQLWPCDKNIEIFTNLIKN